MWKTLMAVNLEDVIGGIGIKYTIFIQKLDRRNSEPIVLLNVATESWPYIQEQIEEYCNRADRLILREVKKDGKLIV